MNNCDCCDSVEWRSERIEQLEKLLNEVKAALIFIQSKTERDYIYETERPEFNAQMENIYRTSNDALVNIEKVLND